tara:strand:+ start:5726 stop:6811 length:1086 start_codon:yes stop_codon:yes gene_type:complete
MTDREEFEQAFINSRANEHGCRKAKALKMLERDGERYNNIYVEGLWQGYQLQAARTGGDCTRSHPHEDMGRECELKSEIAKLQSEAAHLKAARTGGEVVTIHQYPEWPILGFNYLVRFNGVWQFETYVFDQGDDGNGGGEYFWNRNDVDEGRPFDPENDAWIDPSAITTHPTPSSKAEPSIIDDESPARRVGELGNMLHNLSCEHQNNEQLLEQLETLSSEAWDISKSLSPRTPAAAVPDGYALVPISPTHDQIKAMSESRATDDDGEFPMVCDLIDFSGENKTHTVLREAYASAIADAPPAVVPEVNTIAKTLETAWAKAEPDHSVTNHPLSYRATFCDMAKSVIDMLTAAPKPVGDGEK